MRTSRQVKQLLFRLLALTIFMSTFFPNQTLAIEFENTLEQRPQIAILLPLSGPFTDLGQTLQKGFELGFTHFEESLPNTRNFEIRYFDSQRNPETTSTLIALFSSEGETVFAAGTPLNTTAWTASKSAEENGVPFLIVGADQDNLINEKSVFTFRINQTRSAQAVMLSEFIVSQEPAIQSMGIIYGEGTCATRQARRLRKLCAKQNIDLAIWETYRSDERNFYDLLTLIKERQPQLLVLATNPAAGDKLWQQGQRLELVPPVTIATPTSCGLETYKPTSYSRLEAQMLYTTPWFIPANQENYPPLENYLIAQGFAATEIILASLNKSLDLTSGEIVKALEKTNTTTAYGPVFFSGSGQGHQNPLPWYLSSYDKEGINNVVFPLPPGQEKTTPKANPASAKSSDNSQTDKPTQ